MEEPSDMSKDNRDKAHVIIAEYIKPILLVIGIVGNILSIVVLRKRSFKNSTAVYLLMIAIASLIYVFFYIPFVVKEYVTDGSDAYVWGMISYQCYVGLFILDSASFWAFWMTAIVAVERCIVVGLPLSSKIICRRKYAWITCGVILVIAALLNIPRCLECRPVVVKDYDSPTNTTVDMEMVKLPGYNMVAAAFASIIISSIIPFVIIVCSNIILLVFMIRRWRIKNNSSFEEPPPTNVYAVNINAAQRKGLTAMVVSNLGLFILSQSLVTALYIKVFIDGYKYLEKIMDESIGFYSNTLSLTYFCFSSLTYLIISSVYRKTVKKLFYNFFNKSYESSASIADYAINTDIEKTELESRSESDGSKPETNRLYTSVI